MEFPYHIQFPPILSNNLSQDEAYFYLYQNGDKHTVRFHDYHTIYSLPGLYEQVFYERLQCRSPQQLATMLNTAVQQDHQSTTTLRVLDLAAGNGLMGETLKKQGVSRLVGVDILPEARTATIRDRPNVYNEYYVWDFNQLTAKQHEELSNWHFNCLTCVSALGFGDIPVSVFMTALNLLSIPAWIAFNIKEDFLQSKDKTGFSQLVRNLIFSNVFRLHHIERYCHRLSIEGKPLYYFAIVGQKLDSIKV